MNYPISSQQEQLNFLLKWQQLSSILWKTAFTFLLLTHSEIQCENCVFLSSQILDHPEFWKTSESIQVLKNKVNLKENKTKQNSTALWQEVAIASMHIK